MGVNGIYFHFCPGARFMYENKNIKKMLTYYVWYVIIIIEREGKVRQNSTMKKALERVYDKIEVEEMGV